MKKILFRQHIGPYYAMNEVVTYDIRADSRKLGNWVVRGGDTKADLVGHWYYPRETKFMGFVWLCVRPNGDIMYLSGKCCNTPVLHLNM